MGHQLLATPRTSAGTAHTNSTDEAVLDSVTIPARTLAAGKVLRFTGQVRATATNSTDTLTVNAKVGAAATVAGTTAVGTSGAVDAADNDTCGWDISLVPRAAAGSTSGTVQVFGHMSSVGAEGTVTHRQVYQLLSSVDYTAALYFVISADWSVASTSNSVQAEAMVAELIY